MAKGTKKLIEQYGEVVQETADFSSPDIPVGTEERQLKKLANKGYKMLLDQLQSEFTLCDQFMRPKWTEWGVRLKLYNNQRRDKDAIGDPLLFTIHQTVLATLYDDRLAVRFSPRERGDEETADNLTDLAEFDYSDMQKDELDYYWDWDATFFGRGLVLFMEFDRDKKCPIPINIDPFTFYRDPKAKSVNGDIKHNGALRMWGYEIKLTKRQMREAGVYFNIERIKADTGMGSVVDQNSALRDEAQGRDNVDSKFEITGENREYRILRWFTHYQGKKVMVETANDRKLVVRYYELPNKESWPLIDRACFPMSKDWDGVSIPDLVEDKQRARSVAQNLALKGVKSGLKPKYLFNSNKIKKTYLQKEELNRHIPIDGDPNNAIVPVQTQQVKAEVQWILGVLDSAAQRATASPGSTQGQVSATGNPTATEIEKAAQGSDTRYSLSAKIFGWSERWFWRQWYFLYKTYFAKDIDEKMIRINGAGANKWRKLLKDNIVAIIDPDVEVESKVIADAKRRVQLQGYQNWLNLALSYPSSNKLFAIRQLGRLNGVSNDLIDAVIPPTIDELAADVENETLSNNEKVLVEATDDHVVHIEVHRKAAETPAKFAHIEAHKKAMAIKKVRPDLFPQVPSEQMPSESVMTKTSSATGQNMPMSGSPVFRGAAPAQLNNGQE